MSNTECRCRKATEFRGEYRRTERNNESCLKSCFTCNKRSAYRSLSKLVPAYRIMKKYHWKKDLIQDIICGLTIGIMQLPQGMAYAMLAEMPPVVGLYMSFFPVLIYFFLGTSRHLSMGTVAVVSLLTGGVIARFYDDSSNVAVTSNTTDVLSGQAGATDPFDSSSMLDVDVKLGIVMTLSLLVGVTQIIMGTLRLGFVTTYMSDPLISGFTTASAVHVGTSQVKYIFGLKIPRTDGLFQVVKTYVYIIERISQTNLYTLGVSLICVVIIYLVKVQINHRFKDKLKIPIPIELIVVVLFTLGSHFWKFNENYHIKIVGYVPAGLPAPALPSFKGIDMYFSDIFIIAVISFAQSVSLAALMAKKHRYTIDANQELIAYGAGNMFGAFFSCYPIASSVSRTSVVDSAGGKSQLASLVSASLVLVVILFLGPLFESLPNCVLSAVIVVALRSLLLQVLELPKVWRTSKYDFLIWVVTCLCATLLHVDYGLLIGLVFSFFTVVLRTQKVAPTRLGKITDEKVFKDPKAYIKTHTTKAIKVIGYQSPLYFANGDLFVKEVYRLSTVKPERLRKQIRRASMLLESRRKSAISFSDDSRRESDDSRRQSILSLDGNVTGTSILFDLDYPTLPGLSPITNGIDPVLFENPITNIVIDFSAITFVDTVGCKVLTQLIQEYDNVNIQVVFANVSDDVWNVFEATEILPKYGDRVFLTLDDAIGAANLDNGSPDYTDKFIKSYNAPIPEVPM